MNRSFAKRLELCAGVLFALTVIPIVAQSKPEPADMGSGLKLRLVIRNPEICVDSKSLAFEVVLTNEDNQPIAVYKSSLSEFAFTSQVRNGKTSTHQGLEDEKGAPESSRGTRESPITIQPHSSVVVPLKHDVSATFFYGADIYSLQVGYRDIKSHADSNAFKGHEKSNVALFRRIPCE
jgi:hypothetical protein